jgi:single-stranded DNA-specific DHH superfamily exonuclease
MLTSKQIQEIKEHLEKAQNPVFFFDNDQDGLCSFLLLQRAMGRGKGVPVKSFPDLNDSYFHKVQELNADYIFILDKPVVSKSFFDEAEKVNMPVVWVDHHNPEDVKIKIPKSVNYYNSFSKEKKMGEPVTLICWEVVQNDKDMWLAVMGCISDKFFPDFYEEFKKDFPELAINSEQPFEIFYKAEIGKVARMLGAGLKDKTTNVINMLRFLMKAGSPHDVLQESSKNKTMHQRFDYFDKKFQKFIEKALEGADDYENLIYFQYAGDLSISADLSNYLNFLFPEKDVIVVYVSGVKGNISGRGKGIRERVLKAIENLDGATGGGHEDAVGAQVLIDDLPEFKKSLLPESK